MMMVPGQPQPAPTPFSGIVTASIQYDGTVSASSTASLGGTIVEFQFPKGSIQVNPDCTATFNYTGVTPQFPGQAFPGTLKYIVLDNGNELLGLDTKTTGGFPIVLEDLKRISMMPLASGQ